jgi:hypothetical protein
MVVMVSIAIIQRKYQKNKTTLCLVGSQIEVPVSPPCGRFLSRQSNE